MLSSKDIKVLTRWGARAWVALWSCASLFAVVSCKLDEKPAASGGLIVAVDSDMAMPKDIDELRIDVTQGDTSLFSHRQPLGEGEDALPHEFEVTPGAGGAPVLVRAVALKAGLPRIERSAITPIPSTYIGYLRLTLNYLCDGMVSPEGDSSCEAGSTCVQGVCASALVAEALPDYHQRPDALQSDPQGAEACFDVTECLSDATERMPDPETCAFDAPELYPTTINVGLRMELGEPGVCTQSACWIVLNLDDEGFQIDEAGMRVVLPRHICERREQGENLRVAFSMQCPTKTETQPLCRSVPQPSFTEDNPPVAVGMSMMPAIQDACAGGGTQACEMCGSQMRMCQSGLWSDYGICMDQGVCVPNAEERCGMNGMRQCGGDCTWGACENQPCDGPSTRACGNCGTQRRTCNNGVWTEWSDCADEGECAPGTTQDCGATGVRACGGSCAWGECSGVLCEGAASDACGNCGTQTRTCDAATMLWSEWGECAHEGECQPDSTRACGDNNSGTQTCGGDCQWDPACTGQRCDGPATRACGLCGTQTRTCDMNTGTWSDWTDCFGQGECEPDTARVCGIAGTQKCGGNCRWDAACTGQVCLGANSRPCGDCGVQTRTCNSNTGAWSAWSICRDQGECQPGSTRTCGSGGTQTCTNQCTWDNACPGQQCSGPNTEACGNCGTRARTCNTNTGKYLGWGPCSNEGVCSPTAAPMACTGAHSERTCNRSCKWNECACGSGYEFCPGAGCVDLKTSEDHCGACNVACVGSQQCVQTAANKWECQCPPGTELCGNACVNTDTNGAHCGRCDHACGGGALCKGGVCECGETDGAAQLYCEPPLVSSPVCVDPNTSNDNCKACGHHCEGGRMCKAGDCQCPSGRTDCGEAGCKDTMRDPDNCGGCGREFACARGEVCKSGVCTLDCGPGLTPCGGRCVDLSKDPQHCGACSGPNAVCLGMSTCQNGTCACPADRPCKDDEGTCVALGTNSHCQNCKDSCTGGRSCESDGEGKRCTCPSSLPCSDAEGGTCAPLGTDSDCKACGDACAGGQSCQSTSDGKACLCPAGSCFSGGQCIDFGTDSSCEQCGVPCPGGKLCRDNTCSCPSDSCPDSKTGGCAPLGTNVNCTSCGSSCTGGQICQTKGERHVCGCDEGMCLRDGVCIDDNTDDSCEACGVACAGGKMCQNHSCVCAADSCLDAKTGKCVEPNGMCADGKRCQRGQCDCPSNSCMDGDSCVAPGQTCADGSTCQDGRCGCPPNTCMDNGSCIAAGKLCSDGLTCQNGQCTCPSTSCMDSGKCIAPGQMCAGGLTCENGQCTCPSTSCMESGRCIAPGQMCADGLICQNGACACPANTCADAGRCITAGQMCSDGLTCENGRCTCPATSCMEAGKCIPPGQMCAGGLTCENGQCTCPSTSCMDSGACIAPGQMCADGTTCRNGVCACPPDTCADAGRCIAAGQMCADGLTCQNGRCTCPSTSCMDSGACIAPGQMCAGGLTCENGQCTCPSSSCMESGRCIAPGQSCGDGKTCQRGECACPANTCTDSGKCIAAGQMCAGGLTCVQSDSGGYACDCPNGQTRCEDGRCYDLNKDDKHCGSCTKSCGATASCNEGDCVCESTGEAECGSTCCPGGVTCVNNRCGGCADPSQHLCGNACVPRSEKSCTNCDPCPSAPANGTMTCTRTDTCQAECNPGSTLCNDTACCKNGTEMCTRSGCVPVETGGTGGTGTPSRDAGTL